MIFQDWPLVMFTLLAQLSVGSYIVLGLVRYSSDGYESNATLHRMLGRGRVWIFALMAIALIISLTHLGSPFNAPFTLLGVGTAWLSREILFGLLFTLIAGLSVFSNRRRARPTALSRSLFIAGAFSGIALIYSMSMIYRYIDTRPAWSTPWTTVMFFVTSGLLGSLAVAVVMSAGNTVAAGAPENRSDWYDKTLRFISVAALLFIGLEVLVFFLYMLGLFNGVPAAQETARQLLNHYVVLFVLKIVLALAGAVWAGLLLSRIAVLREQKRCPIFGVACGAFAFILAAEVIGRYLFYAVTVRIGI